MNDSTIAVRYARALFESARENNLLDQVRQDMMLLKEVCGISEFQFLLKSPLFPDSKKCSIIENLMKENVQKLTISLVDLVVKNGRELYLQGIARNFLDMYMKHRGIKSAQLTSAGPMDASLQEKIVQVVENTLKTEIELAVLQDSELIGGFVMRIEDQQYDASVASSLKKIRKQLLNN
jgi:F-type H+-transporting ATPase subunit delta